MAKRDMLELKDVTLFTVEYDNSFDAIEKSMKFIRFGKIMTKAAFSDVYDYSHYILKELNLDIKTDYVLIVQHDGYVLNPKAWNDDFLNYDYIGAPWWYQNNNVGNGGFSLRSKKLLKATAEFDFGNIYHPEDDVLCRKSRHLFEGMGFKWAPESLAAKFSWEPNAKYPEYNNQFGFHCSNYTPKVK